jgi:hypothetical protein
MQSVPKSSETKFAENGGNRENFGVLLAGFGAATLWPL